MAEKKRHAISPDDCVDIRLKYKDGLTASEIAEEYDVHPRTVRRHLHNGCSHDNDITVEDYFVSEQECGKMREQYSEDVIAEIADDFDVSNSTVARHVYGRCNHDGGVFNDSSTPEEGDNLIKWVCEVCGGIHNERKEAISHVTHAADEKHLRHNPYDVTSMTFVDMNSSQKNTAVVEVANLIRDGKIHRHGPDIATKEIDYISDNVGVCLGRVIRVLQDADIEYEFSQSHQPITHIEDASEYSQTVLEYCQEHGMDIPIQEISDDTGVNESTVTTIRQRHGWLVTYTGTELPESGGNTEKEERNPQRKGRVSKEECKIIQELYSDGASYDEICDAINGDRKNSTLREHGSGLCHHGKLM